MENLNQKDWREKLAASSNAVIIDVRAPEECEEGIIPGAHQLNIFNAALFMAEMDVLDKSKEYFMYCRSGGRSGQACQIMASKGFEKAYNLEGGMMAWKGEIVTPKQY